MLKVLFTLDYEIHGNGEGDSYALMVEPTRRMMDLFERYGAKLTIMADVAEILKFREYKEQFGRDDYHYEAIANQLKEAVQRGHDVQLHLHPSYFNARFEHGRWAQDWTEYNFAALPLERLNELVSIGKRFLEDLLKPVAPLYKCIAFRAANWAVSPSRSVVRALLSNGIQIESSVFKYGRRGGVVAFDYSNAHSKLVPWLVDENDICQRNDGGQLLEVPIYCEYRWIGAFLTANRLHRALLSRAHPIPKERSKKVGTELEKSSHTKKLLFRLSKLICRHAWKADFNQCTGWQLARALWRAAGDHDAKGDKLLPFVLIGHSKLFTPKNERTLEPFLNYVARNTSRFCFGALGSWTAPRHGLKPHADERVTA